MKKKILIVRLSALGDVIFSLPALQRLKKLDPEAAVSWLVEDKAATLLMDRRDLERILVYPRKAMDRSLKNPLRWPGLLKTMLGHLGGLRRERYDAIYDLQGNLKSGVQVLLARGRRKVGFARGYVKERNDWFTKEHVTPPGHAVHRIEKAVSLVEPDFHPGTIERPDLDLPQSVVEESGHALEALLPGSDRLMIVHPGTSSFGAYKRWASEKYGQLCRRMHEEHGFTSLATWGPGERPLAEAVAASGGGSVYVAPRSPTLLHLAAYLQAGDCFVSADSGPLHLANFLGIPCLGVFGPKDPALYRPYFPPSAVVRRDVDCSPCTRRHCDDPICMKQLEVDEVYAALLALIKED